MARRGGVVGLRRDGRVRPMIGELGAFALVLSLVFAVAQTVLSAVGRMRASVLLTAAGGGAAIASSPSVGAAFAALTAAFLVSDYSVSNVAENSHTAKPLLYKIAGVCGNHEGSLLLWCAALTGFGAAAATLGRSLPWGLRATTTATQGALGVLFLAFATFASNPFLRLDPAPVEGRSLNPLLQDPALAAVFDFSGHGLCHRDSMMTLSRRRGILLAPGLARISHRVA